MHIACWVTMKNVLYKSLITPTCLLAKSRHMFNSVKIWHTLIRIKPVYTWRNERFQKNPSNIGCLTLFRPIFLYIDLVVPGEHFLIRVNVQQFIGYTRPIWPYTYKEIIKYDNYSQFPHSVFFFNVKVMILF